MRLIRNIIKNTILLSLSILIVSPMSVLAQDMSSAQSEADRARAVSYTHLTLPTSDLV